MIEYLVGKLLTLFGYSSSTISNMDNEEMAAPEEAEQQEQPNPDDVVMEDIDSSDDDEQMEGWQLFNPDDDNDSMWSIWSDPDSCDSEQFWENIHFLRWRNALKSRYRSEYTFKALKLVKCDYKGRDIMDRFPVARSGHRVIASESHLYCLGGYNPRNEHLAARRGRCSLFQELWSYNFATNRWKLMLNTEKAANMPRELASNALDIYDNVLIAHGGTGYPFGESCSNDCYVYTTGDKPIVVKLEVTGELPLPQYGPGIVIHNGYLYTIGGTTGFDYSCDVYRLNLMTKVWENVYICRPEMRDDPEGRYRHEVVCDGKHIYVLGGGTAHIVYDLQRIPAFDLQTNKWVYFDTLPDKAVIHENREREEQETGYPKPRKCLSCVQHTTSNGDIEVFISGGLQGDYNTYFSDIWRLNLRTKQWSLIPASLPKPLYFHSAAHAGNGCMYIFGGIEYAHKQLRRTNELYKMWLTVPKLSEMCWEAITYYNEDIDQDGTETLLKTGIPQRFEKRLPTARRALARNPATDFEGLREYMVARKKARSDNPALAD